MFEVKILALLQVSKYRIFQILMNNGFYYEPEGLLLPERLSSRSLKMTA